MKINLNILGGRDDVVKSIRSQYSSTMNSKIKSNIISYLKWLSLRQSDTIL